MSKLLDAAPIISMMFFFGVFLIIAWRAYRPAARKRMQQDAMIPLNEDNHD